MRRQDLTIVDMLSVPNAWDELVFAEKIHEITDDPHDFAGAYTEYVESRRAHGLVPLMPSAYYRYHYTPELQAA